jgi:hypothetical protein
MISEPNRPPVSDARRKQLPEVRVLLRSDARDLQRQANSVTYPGQPMLKVSATA